VFLVRSGACVCTDQERVGAPGALVILMRCTPEAL
jgi:hypothetical protein